MAIFGYRILSMSWSCITKCVSDERSWWVMINRKPKDVIVLSQILWEWQNMWYKAGHLFACHRLLDCKKKVCHLITIISISHSSISVHIPTNLMGSILVRKIDVPFLMHRSMAEWFLGADRWAVFSSINNN